MSVWVEIARDRDRDLQCIVSEPNDYTRTNCIIRSFEDDFRSGLE